MAEFDFEIEHHPGKDHVVPDTLSRDPIPEPSTVGDNLVIPVDSFLIMTLGQDIPFIDPSSVSEVFKDALQCITLSCSPTIQTGFLQEIANFSTTALRYIFPLPSLIPTPPPLQVETPADVTPQWSGDLENLHALNISRTNFAEKQRQDTWLGPLFQYLILRENISVLANLPIKACSWVRTTAPN